MPTLVTVSTDGFRDYVDLPDGRQLNLGSISVLNFVTSLVRSSNECRKALDRFLETGSTLLKVDMPSLEALLRPRRSRWAMHGDPFIPNGFRQHFRGAGMNSVQCVKSHLDEIEKHVASLQQDSEQDDKEEKTARVRELAASLLEVATGEGASGLGLKLAALETTLSSIASEGASESSVQDLRSLAASLYELTTGKTAAVDEDAKRELKLYMVEESKLIRQKQEILKNIMRKMQSGKYDQSSAPKLWLYWVDEGAKMYVREFGGEARQIFPKELREDLAKEIAVQEKKLIEDGEYDNLKLASEEQQNEQASQEDQEKTAEDQEAKQSQESEQDQEKTAGLRLSSDEVVTVNEALAHSVMAKVEGALRAIEASDRSGADVAKKDLNTLSTKLFNLIEASDFNKPKLREDLKKLAKMADQVHSHFAV